MDVVFLITTYNRQESCQRLVDSLQGQGDIVVLGDAVDYIITGCQFCNLPHHGGRTLYYQTVKQLWSMRGAHDYYFMLPDDFLPVDDMVSKAIHLWNSIDDPKKICLNLYADRIGKRCWTKVDPIDKGDVWQTGWVDLCFMSKDDFFQKVSHRLTYQRIGNGSGVGAQVSRTLVGAKYSLFQVKDSLVYPQGEHGASQMHVNTNVSRHEIKQKNRRHSLNTIQNRRSPDRFNLDKRSS